MVNVGAVTTGGRRPWKRSPVSGSVPAIAGLLAVTVWPMCVAIKRIALSAC
jgi:hypothetical protein